MVSRYNNVYGHHLCILGCELILESTRNVIVNCTELCPSSNFEIELTSLGLSKETVRSV